MSDTNTPYQSLSIDDAEADRLALDLLRRLDGLPVAVVRRVLRQADFWLDAVTVLDCGPATEFQRAVAGFQAASGQPL